MIRKSSEVVGVQTALRGMREFRLRTRDNIVAGLKIVGQIVFDESQRLVPVDTANLKSSGLVVNTGSGFAARVIISYTTNYAIFVHEDLTKYHTPPTQAKFLSQAVLNKMAECNKAMGRRVGARTTAIKRAA